MNESLFPFVQDGLLVGPTRGLSGDIYYAEVVPASSCWLPWPGRTSRWWYEVHAAHEPNPALGVNRTTYAYERGGSGGGFTLGACVRRAADAVVRFAEGE